MTPFEVTESHYTMTTAAQRTQSGRSRSRATFETTNAKLGGKRGGPLRFLPLVLFVACSRQSPVPITPDPAPAKSSVAVVEIARGVFHTCALLANHRVQCSGKNDSGQLGDGTTQPRTGFVEVVGVVDATQISKGGWASTCALHADHSVSCWGSYNGSALGVDPSKCVPHPSWTNKTNTAPYACGNSPVLGLPPTVVQIAQSANGACARMDDGTVRCWGSSVHGELGYPATAPMVPPRAVAGIDRATFLALGQTHACALREDRTVWCWGGNEYGQLGDGTQTDRTAPKLVPGLTDVVEIDLGQQHSCARRNDGHVWCWGSNVFGEIGNKNAMLDECRVWALDKWNPVICRKTPTEVFGVTHAVQISAGDLETCARHDDGTLSCWPSDADGGPAKATAIKRAKGRTLRHISLGNQRAFIFGTDNKIEFWDAADHVLKPF